MIEIKGKYNTAVIYQEIDDTIRTQAQAPDYDKEFRRVLSERAHNIQLSDEYASYIYTYLVS